MTRWYWSLCLALVFACGSKGEEAKPKKNSKPTVVADAAPTAAKTPDADNPPPPPLPKPKKLTNAEKKQFARLLAQGRAAQKKKNWTKSIELLEKALVVQPTSAAALSDLSWSAFNAGDYKRAIKAGEDSVALSIDPRTRAASLYNLGRAAEKLEQPKKAIAYYQRSLRLRPHKTVRKRLVSLGGEVPALFPTPPCPKPGDDKQMCECLLKNEEVAPPRYVGSCKARNGRMGLRAWLARVEDNDRERAHGNYYLVRETATKLTVVAKLPGSHFSSHKMMEEVDVVRVLPRTVGGRKLFRVETSQRRYVPADYLDASSARVTEWLTAKWLTICFEDEGFIKCPLSAPIEYNLTKDIYELSDASENDRDQYAKEAAQIRRAYKKKHGKKLPHIEETKLEVKVSNDGTAKVELVSGPKSKFIQRYLGSRKLW